MPHDTDDEVRKQQRAPIDGGRDASPREDDEGVPLNVPSYADTGGVSDLGVDEPVVPQDVRGENAADQPDLPVEDGTPPPRRD
jgi:hypothetical protein